MVGSRRPIKRTTETEERRPEPSTAGDGRSADFTTRMAAASSTGGTEVSAQQSMENALEPAAAKKQKTAPNSGVHHGEARAKMADLTPTKEVGEINNAHASSTRDAPSEDVSEHRAPTATAQITVSDVHVPTDTDAAREQPGSSRQIDAPVVEDNNDEPRTLSQEELEDIEFKRKCAEMVEWKRQCNEQKDNIELKRKFDAEMEKWIKQHKERLAEGDRRIALLRQEQAACLAQSQILLARRRALEADRDRYTEELDQVQEKLFITDELLALTSLLYRYNTIST